MTTNQINYWNLQELARHNVETEGETKRHDIVSEFNDANRNAETHRHNVVGEGQNAIAVAAKAYADKAAGMKSLSQAMDDVPFLGPIIALSEYGDMFSDHTLGSSAKTFGKTTASIANFATQLVDGILGPVFDTKTGILYGGNGSGSPTPQPKGSGAAAIMGQKHAATHSKFQKNKPEPAEKTGQFAQHFAAGRAKFRKESKQ